MSCRACRVQINTLSARQLVCFSDNIHTPARAHGRRVLLRLEIQNHSQLLSPAVLFLVRTPCETLPDFVPFLYCFCTRFLGCPKCTDAYRRQGQALLSAGLLLAHFWLATGRVCGQSRTEQCPLFKDCGICGYIPEARTFSAACCCSFAEILLPDH